MNNDNSINNDLNCYIIGGSNGAGKSTFAQKFLPNYAGCYNFINADLIARGLSPFKPEQAAFQAGKLVFEQINTFTQKKQSFAIESTLSGRSYFKIFKELKQLGTKFIFSIYGFLLLI